MQKSEVDAVVTQVSTRFEDKLDNIALRNEMEYKNLIAAQESNTLAIRDLTSSIASWVEVHRTAVALQKFFKWLGGFAILGTIVAWVLKEFTL
jgi:hypothetical protein